MNFSTLVKRNLSHFRRTNLAVIFGVATATAVLAGALLVGDSVRASLQDLALSRLGKTDLLVASTGFFREQLADDLKSADSFGKWFNDACPLIAIEGVVTHSDSNARAGGVAVYGVDERFWKFHGSGIAPVADNDMLASAALASELGAKPGDTLILRIEKPSAIPVESLHSRKEDLGRSVRLTLREALPQGSIGEFSLRPQQGAVRAIFLPLKKLQRNLEQDHKANAILVSQIWPDQEAMARRKILHEGIVAGAINEKFSLADLGLKLRLLADAQAISLESDSAVLSDALAEKAKTAAAGLNFKSESFLTYLANSIRIGDKEVPYSLVTAIAQNNLAKLSPNGIALNEWAARDLGAKLGDEVSLDYYVWKEEGRLDTGQAKFKLEAIVPIQGLAADRNLSPEYPGISDAKSLADWDPPFPVDLSRVRKVDEDYWDKYRTTPKAFISLEAGQKLWGTRWGKLTSIRIYQHVVPPSGGNASAASLSSEGGTQNNLSSYEQSLRDSLDPAQMGLTVQPVKAEGMQASRGATDFGEYFTYFSFFLVISALMLTTLFFKLGIEQRLREIGLLRALGFSIKQVRSLFLREGLLLAVIGSLLGLIGAIVYGWAMMFGLRTWWVGAVGTTLLRLHISPISLVIGAVSGVITALLCIWLTLRSLRKLSPRNLLTGSTQIGAYDVRSSAFRRQRERSEHTPPEGGTTNAIFTSSRLAVIFGVLGIAMLVSSTFIGQVGAFFGAGTFLLVALLFFWSAWLKSDKRQTIAGHGFAPMARLGFRNATIRPSRSVLCIALIASAAFIIVSVDAFRKDSNTVSTDPKSGTGGFPLLAESLLPIVHDPNSEQGREELNLTDDNVKGVKLTRFRLRPGDDASCLNLYAPRSPRVLGVTEDFIKANRFSFASSIAQTDEQKTNPWLLLNQPPTTDNQQPIPAIADANSLAYVLHLKVGDETALTSSRGEVVKIKIVAALADSIFQGELLIAESGFIKTFPDHQGYRVFLAETAKPTETAAALEDKLSDYGFDAISTGEKLASFHQVENTYLSTFQTLGGLGLLLGTFGLGTVLLRNVLERRRELAVMRAVGYQSSHLSLMVLAENALLLGCGLLTGVVCAAVAIAPAFIARGGKLSAVSLALLLLAVLLTGLSASLVAVRAAVRSPLLTSLRTE
ncbi:MAG: ABC transporter permease [Acidobacteria bacterium]|nr:ABC transporter permease [Acidobacteriota bacterium]